MPRLNHGTLLENQVVLEVTRVLATTAESTLEFAYAYAMPPLTQCWHNTQHEPRNNPKFNANVMVNLINGVFQFGDRTSYSALLLDCLRNHPQLPVVPYAGTDAKQRYEYGGPNGALLAAMLRRHQGQAIRIWSNDLAGPQGRYHSANAATECPRTNEYANALSGGHGGTLEVDAFCGGEFPATVREMADWRNPCTVRIGFLDPDSYVADGNPGPGQVDSRGHTCWLADLHQDASCTAGIMFFANRDAPQRPMLITAFHNDVVDDYPHSVVFLHGNFMVGVKLRCHDENRMPLIIDGVRNAWEAWSILVGRPGDGLSWSVDGQAAG